MAIQVRLDLTPAEFDLTRRALDTYQKETLAAGDHDADPAKRRAARVEMLAVNDLLKKLNG
jgi:hypothetical protein